VRVLRLDANGQQQQLSLNIADPSSKASLIPIRSGDQIIVDRRRSFFRDILLPTLSIVGSIASVGILIDRVSN
jgi:hypothetical protein